MAAVRYVSIRCDQCLDSDPALSFDNAKEARDYFQRKIGYIRAYRKDFCSEKCKQDYEVENQLQTEAQTSQ